MGLTISQVAAGAQVPIETVRYYEKRGLIEKPPRSDAGYRMFPRSAVHDIRFIKEAQTIGFTLAEIKQLLALYKMEDPLPAEEMKRYALAKIAVIEEQMIRLAAFKALLEQVSGQPNNSQPVAKSECPIIQRCIGEEEERWEPL
ncbi:MerR family transcriptional regulator [Paenibacillus sp. GCM10027627]|uniref:MerR family transcriptional regulator n=1 Tax=unclassified Paenibacillus TaxID=185978 RepID=UPI0036272141